MENKPFHKYRSVWEHAELMERLRRIRHVALDMDGTIYMGMSLFPYTQAFLHGLKEQGIGYSFLTNNPSKSIADYLHKLDTLGIRASRDEMYTTALDTITSGTSSAESAHDSKPASANSEIIDGVPRRNSRVAAG